MDAASKPQPDAAKVLEALLVDWEMGRQLTTPPTPEVLCRNSPEYLEPLREKIRLLRQADALLNLDPVALSGNRSDAAATAPADWPAIPGYEINRFLGAGGMGQVFLARHISLDRPVVIKFIKPTRFAGEASRLRFQREARILFDLHHENIIRIFDAQLHEGRPYITMAYAPGGSLRDHLAKYHHDPEAAVRLIITVAQGVHAAHERGVLHRDLKPGNILLSAAGEPVVGDFGLAKLMEADAGEDEPASAQSDVLVMELTCAGTPMGTPAYMSPEQYGGDINAIGRGADIWALGVILHEMIAGSHPFFGGQEKMTRERAHELVCSGRPTALPEHHASRRVRKLDQIIAKCLRPKPEERYATAAALASDLDSWLTGGQIRAVPETVPEKLQRWTRRYWPRAAFLGLSLLCVVFLIHWLWGSTTEAPPPPPLTPDDIYRATIQPQLDRLQRGETAVLIDGTEKTTPFRVGYGHAKVVQPNQANGKNLIIEANGAGLIELLPDPGVKRYQVTAQLRHDRNLSEHTELGIFVGRQSVSSKRYERHVALRSYFAEMGHGADVLPPQLGTYGVAKMHFIIYQFDRETVEAPTQTPWSAGPEVFYKPSIGSFRELTLTVTPEQVSFVWEGKQVGSLSHREQRDRLALLERNGPEPFPKDFGVPLRGPIGIYALGATLSVRSFVVTPLPD